MGTSSIAMERTDEHERRGTYSRSTPLQGGRGSCLNRPPMTWSIVARDADGAFGIAIASRFFAVGALCVHTRRAVGALSTQALMNPLYGPAGIELLAAGVAPADVVR